MIEAVKTEVSKSSGYDLVVVSAFGRGQWIATELASQGWKTALADVSEQIGNFECRDIEGPFGLFENQDLLPSQRASLNDEGEFIQAPTGFSIWLDEGPLEFRSELTPFLLRARNIPDEVESYVRQSSAKAKETARERKNLKRLHYSHSWLAQFAHSFASATHRENHVALESESASPLFSAYALRQLTPAGTEKGFQLAQTADVTIYRNARVKDIRIEGKTADAIEIETAFGTSLRTGIKPSVKTMVVNGRAFVWCLSFSETKLISESLAQRLFPKEWPEAQWAWQRISFKTNATDLLESLPLSTVLIGDVDLAWTRANMILLRRRAGENALDAWIKVPTWMRRDAPVFADIRGEVRASLEKKLPNVTLTNDGEELSPPLWPVFTLEEFSQLSALKSPNLFFDAPGFWPSIDRLGRFKVEAALIARLEKLRSLWDAAARKAEAARERQARRSVGP